ARLDKTPEGFEVWIYDENQLGQAREALQKFQADPTAAEFQEASKQAARLRSEKEKELKKEIQQYKQTRNAWRPPQPTDLPITMLLIIASVVITLAISLEENSYGLRTDLSITRFEPAGNDMI